MEHIKDITKKFVGGAGIGVALLGTASICSFPAGNSMAKVYKGAGEYAVGLGLLCVYDYLNGREE